MEKMKTKTGDKSKRITDLREPVMYLPRYSYFGDFQILMNLKSNLEYKTFQQADDPHAAEQDILFMCCNHEVFMELCDLFPQTAQNLKERAKKRRVIFMQQKRTKSKKWNEKKKDNPDLKHDEDVDIEYYDSEEDQGERDQQKEEMQKHLEE